MALWYSVKEVNWPCAELSPVPQKHVEKQRCNAAFLEHQVTPSAGMILHYWVPRRMDSSPYIENLQNSMLPNILILFAVQLCRFNIIPLTL
jgi:hypothetical protein